MGSSVSRNINWRDEPATFQGPDPEIFDKYIDESRPVRGKLFFFIKRWNSVNLSFLESLFKKFILKNNVLLNEFISINR